MSAAGDSLAKDLTVEQFTRFRDFIHEHSGIYLEESKLDSLRISLITRATRHSYASLDQYFELLHSDEEEFKELLNLVTINETSFFRFPAQFDALREHVIPEIIANRPGSGRDFRIWSAGCSTGEEPYSIAMTLIDSGMEAANWRPRVLGTDVSTRALATAQEGVYGAKSLLNVPDDVVTRHFDRAERGYRLTRHVRDIVDFGYHNLIKEPYPLSLMGNWDVIFCRNVTIYFQLESTRRVIANLFNSLNDGGYLFIGHSETLSSVSDEFEPYEIAGVFLYHKPRKRRGLSGLRGGRSGTHGEETAERRQSTRQAAAESRASRRERSRVAAGDPAELAEEVSPVGEAALARARELLAEGRSDDVLSLVDTILSEDPNSAQAHLISAYVHADAAEYESALAATHRALAIDPLLPGAHYLLGVISQRAGDVMQAISEFKKTIYSDPDFALAHLNLANINKSRADWNAAARDYENALRALYKAPEGQWTEFLGGFKADLLVKTCERSLLECRKAAGAD